MGIANYHHFNVSVSPDPTNPSKNLVQVQSGQHGLFAVGINMDIAVGVDAITAKSLQDYSLSIPQPRMVKALFDTGCTVTSIDLSIAKALNLKVRGYVNVGTANGLAKAEQYFISIGFPGTTLQGRSLQQVQGIDLRGQQIQALIGRDLMAHWNINYNGIMGLVSISD